MKTFTELQAGLGPALAANVPGSGTPHVVVGLRFLLAGLMVHRIPTAKSFIVLGLSHA